MVAGTLGAGSSDTATMTPLEGVRVLDLTRVLAGPFCTMMLGDMGAEVVKVEEPQSGDEVRYWAPVVDGWSSYFVGVNRNKRSVALDLKSAAGKDALDALVHWADVLVENLRPGALAQLGFGYDRCRGLNPRLIYCSISGYGQTGPKRQLPGYDVVIQGEAGVMDVNGRPDAPPTRMGLAMTDYLAGLYAMQGILLALRVREQDGHGQFVDVALFDSMLSALTLPAGILCSTGVPPTRMGNDHPSIAPYETLEAADGSIVVAVGNQRLWRRFCDVLGRPDLCDDPRFCSNALRVENRPALKAEIRAAFGTRRVEDLVRLFRGVDVPCGPVRTVAEALDDEQVAARDMLLSIPVEGLGTARVLGNPVKLSATPGSIRRPPPRLGQHTTEVLTELGVLPPEG